MVSALDERLLSSISPLLNFCGFEDLDARIEARQREEEEAKRRKKEKKKAKKEAESEKPQNLDGEAAVEEDDMAKMMGFAGFGSTKA